VARPALSGTGHGVDETDKWMAKELRELIGQVHDTH